MPGFLVLYSQLIEVLYSGFEQSRLTDVHLLKECRMFDDLPFIFPTKFITLVISVDVDVTALKALHFILNQVVKVELLILSLSLF